MNAEIIPEDTSSYNLDNATEAEKAEAENFMADNPDLFTTSDNAESETVTPEAETPVVHNEDSEIMTLGKYESDEKGNELPGSYSNVAKKTDSAYFANEDYGKIQQEGDYSDEEMYKQSGNEKAVNDAIDEGKDLQFSHDPNQADGGLGREWETIQNRTGANAEDLSKDEEGRLHLDDYQSYHDETPPYDPKDYE